MPRNKENTDSKNLQDTYIKYQAVLERNIMESNVLWTRYSAMLVFNSILITAIGFTYNTQSTLPAFFSFILPFAGLISCCLWYQVTSRGFQWIRFWFKKARKIEEYQLNGGPISDGKEHREFVVGWPNTELASKLLIGIILILYLILILGKFLNYSPHPKHILPNQMYYYQQK